LSMPAAPLGRRLRRSRRETASRSPRSRR
jgi:hypothetical protein